MDLYEELAESSLLYEEQYEQLLEAAEINKVSVIQFLALKPIELTKILKRSINEITSFQIKLKQEYLEHLNSSSCVFTTTTKHDKNDINFITERFTTGEESIDELLGGGIYTQNITEVFGESSTGKTQFLMQLALTVQLDRSDGGLSGKCVYISTEGDLATNRVEQILASRFGQTDTHVSQKNIFYVSCSDLDNQTHILDVQLPVLLEKHKSDIRLIIIDSISHHIRAEYETFSFIDSQRNRYKIEEMSNRLLYLATKYNLSIVVANQVSNKIFNIGQYERIDARANFQEFEKYDHQLGYMAGWKNSNIKYSQMLIDLRATMTDDFLSDNEELMYLEKLSEKVYKKDNKTEYLSGNNNTKRNSLNDKTTTETTNTNNGKSKQERKRNGDNDIKLKRKKKSMKRVFDTKIPTLGLSWSNNVSTRILLTKSYIVSPVLKDKKWQEISFEDLKPEKALVKQRLMKLVYSTFARGNRTLKYKITNLGIKGAC
ncbi:related to DNA repair protein RAD57 [Saccharomycodes ludwigii]|uniref:Related to DNA repair protein RAD57 n=1 Tax=Saccharomycodes ludwigii TaxID=36035 RepID=A0A376B4G5_9ASCO|nr:hypothetical protein SCDLUD_002529 [Saccharomycodes ludwigii]KAH3901055.1 hypothetical protein SCDLUD_002529 [Saccharomycodes ludwigii]SSD59585.1 related to DNA repair protein RAD57 [Saccharomycodes ludwigii]